MAQSYIGMMNALSGTSINERRARQAQPTRLCRSFFSELLTFYLGRLMHAY
jgi:hypothetical protein